MKRYKYVKKYDDGGPIEYGGPTKEGSMLDQIPSGLQEQLDLAKEFSGVQTTTEQTVQPTTTTIVADDTRTFGQAFAEGRQDMLKGGSKTFSWRGKVYGTDLAITPTTTPVATNYAEGVSPVVGSIPTNRNIVDAYVEKYKSLLKAINKSTTEAISNQKQW